MTDHDLWVPGDKVVANPRRAGETVTIRLIDRHGREQTWTYHNTVTTVGKEGIADQLLDAPAVGVPTHMAIGTGTPGATALGSELDRNAFTSKTRSGAIITVVGDWAAGDGTGAITESGWFNAAAGGTMFVSSSFAVVNKGASDILQISHDLEIT